MKKSDTVKKRILTTAIKLFSKHGFDDTSFAMIAKKSRVSPTGPFYYFKSKEDLVEGALEQIKENNSKIVQSALKPNDNGLMRIRKHFEMNLYWARHYGDEAQVILLIYYKATFDKKWAQLYQTIRDGARLKILEHLLAAQREGFLKNRTQPQVVAEILHDALLGGIVNAVSVQQIDPKAFQGVSEKWDLLIRDLIK